MHEITLSEVTAIRVCGRANRMDFSETSWSLRIGTKLEAALQLHQSHPPITWVGD